MPPRRRILIAGLIFILLAAGAVVFARIHTASAIGVSDLQTCIKKVPNGNITDDNDCIKRIVDALLPTYPTKDLMSYLVAKTSPALVQDQCHDIAHVIGEETYARSPSIETALNACTYDCAYGCIHGVVGAAVVKELGSAVEDEEDIAHEDGATIRKIGEKYCDSGGALCHAVGHILYQSYKAYPGALSTCDAISAGQHREDCYQGVFMESAGEQHSLMDMTPAPQVPQNDLSYPCDQVSLAYQHACFRYLPEFQDILFNESDMDPAARMTAAMRTCDSFAGKSRDDCYEFIGYYNSEVFKGAAPVATFCDQVPTSEKDACVLGIIYHDTDFGEDKSAFEYCAASGSAFCYDALFKIKSASWDDGSIQAECETVSQSSQCLAAFLHFQEIKDTLPNYEFGLQRTSQSNSR